MSTDLLALEVPRHVHRPNGESRIVATHDDLETAVREGWFVDPNKMTEPERHALTNPDSLGLVADHVNEVISSLRKRPRKP